NGSQLSMRQDRARRQRGGMRRRHEQSHAVGPSQRHLHIGQHHGLERGADQVGDPRHDRRAPTMRRSLVLDERGFSLTELLLVCVIVGMVMAGILALQQQGQLAYLWGSTRVEVQQNARMAVDLMTRELRSATSVTPNASCSDAYSPTTTTNGANTITFVDVNAKTVTYAKSGA